MFRAYKLPVPLAVRSLATEIIRRAASSISDAVVVAPRLTRKEPPTMAWSQLIARSTGDGSLEPLAHADPVEQ
jgi:hypothetical protein